MKLIVGLGNPGMQYIDTRHNIGFKAIDKIAQLNDIVINRKAFKAEIGQGIIAGEAIILMKPITGMNASGEAVSACMMWYKLEPKDVLVIYDDISLEVAQIRIRKNGSAGGQNGIKSIIQHLDGDGFPRIKIGVGEKISGWDLGDYVLSKFSEDEARVLQVRLTDVNNAVEMMIRSGIDAAMNDYNGKLRR